MIWILCPAVELPVSERDLRLLGSADKDGTGIAGPDSIGFPAKELNQVESDMRFVQHAFCGSLVGSVVYQNAYSLTANEVTDDVGVNPGDAVKFARPIPPVVRPCDPDRKSTRLNSS